MRQSRHPLRKKIVVISPRGLTLIELLIAIVITLILMVAMIQAFIFASAEITKGRAVLELSSQLRSTSDRLKSDLSGVTVPVRPWINPADGLGYFEILEGPYNDLSWRNLKVPSQNPQPGEPAVSEDLFVDDIVYPDQNNDDRVRLMYSYVGDFDDVLMFTARSHGKPFRGRYVLDGQIRIIESNLAEIIWWTEFNDIDDDNYLDPNETLTLHRRVLLVRPDLNHITSTTTGAGYLPREFDQTNSLVLPYKTVDDGQLATGPAMPNGLKTFFNMNDISVRISNGRLVANTLGDLTKRENRFGRWVDDVLQTEKLRQVNPQLNPMANNNANYRFPYIIDREMLSELVLDDEAEATPTVVSGSTDNVPILAKGEDVVLSFVSAFDVRVFDPDAPIYDDRLFRSSGTGQLAVAPGDPPYDKLLLADLNSNSSNGFVPTNFIAKGAFVDLYYARNLYSATGFNSGLYRGLNALSPFSGRPDEKSQMRALWLGPQPNPIDDFAVYDTWPTHYENDGINTDRILEFRGMKSEFDGNTYESYGVDQGTDGIDTNATSGTDDILERETSPPYPYPLRGIQVTIRVVEPDTQQIRQSRVISNFVSE